MRLLPLQDDPDSAARVRQLALELAARDAGFAPLRAKIHNAPDAGDAARVRELRRAARAPRAPSRSTRSWPPRSTRSTTREPGSQALRELAAHAKPTPR